MAVYILKYTDISQPENTDGCLNVVDIGNLLNFNNSAYHIFNIFNFETTSRKKLQKKTYYKNKILDSEVLKD